jgi:ferritin-like metal-binding protein YciE
MQINQYDLQDPVSLKFILADHLNRIYCAKAHLAERLSEIIDSPLFSDLKFPIGRTIINLNNQLKGLATIYDKLNLKPSFANCQDEISLMEKSFMAIHRYEESRKVRNIVMAVYLYVVDGIETASFQSLAYSAPGIQDPEWRTCLADDLLISGNDNILLAYLLRNSIHGPKTSVLS